PHFSGGYRHCGAGRRATGQTGRHGLVRVGLERGRRDRDARGAGDIRRGSGGDSPSIGGPRASRAESIAAEAVMGAGRRLFLALWPTEEFRAQIEASTLAISRASGGRLIPPRNYHVTLLFLGDVPADSVVAVQEASARLAGSPAFELHFDCIEAWGRKLLCLTSS